MYETIQSAYALKKSAVRIDQTQKQETNRHSNADSNLKHIKNENKIEEISLYNM